MPLWLCAFLAVCLSCCVPLWLCAPPGCVPFWLCAFLAVCLSWLCASPSCVPLLAVCLFWLYASLAVCLSGCVPLWLCASLAVCLSWLCASSGYVPPAELCALLNCVFETPAPRRREACLLHVRVRVSWKQWDMNSLRSLCANMERSTFVKPEVSRRRKSLKKVQLVVWEVCEEHALRVRYAHVEVVVGSLCIGLGGEGLGTSLF
jgi:hypothetical protein